MNPPFYILILFFLSACKPVQRTYHSDTPLPYQSGCYVKVDTSHYGNLYSCFLFYQNGLFVYASHISPKSEFLEPDDFRTAEKQFGQYQVRGTKILFLSPLKTMAAGLVDFPWGQSQLTATITKDWLEMQDVGVAEGYTYSEIQKKVRNGEPITPAHFRFRYKFIKLSSKPDSIWTR